jgi:hypothetical protein
VAPPQDGAATAKFLTAGWDLAGITGDRIALSYTARYPFTPFCELSRNNRASIYIEYTNASLQERLLQKKEQAVRPGKISQDL